MPAPPAETVAEALRPLTHAPERAAIFLDVDGTLAPIVERAEDASVPASTADLLERLVRRYALVACVSGRTAAEARRLVGVEGITYAGSHGGELLEPGESRATVLPALAEGAATVHRFAATLGELGARMEDKGPIVALHWRGVTDEDGVRARLEEVARDAEAAGMVTHWGRKVLELRPPVPVHKGQAVERLVTGSGVRAALYAGDDATDLDAFDALDRLDLGAAVRVGVASDEGPRAIAERADVVVDGTGGLLLILESLA